MQRQVNIEHPAIFKRMRKTRTISHVFNKMTEKEKKIPSAKSSVSSQRPRGDHKKIINVKNMFYFYSIPKALRGKKDKMFLKKPN